MASPSPTSLAALSVLALPVGLETASSLAPGHGWATAGLEWQKTLGWDAFAEVGQKTGWGEVYGRAEGNLTQAQLAIGARW